MRVEGKTVVVTGSAHGIGRALAERFVREGARTVVISDIHEPSMREVAGRLGMPAILCDAGDPASLESLIATVERDIGPIGLMCSNAAYGFAGADTSASQAPDDLNRSEGAWNASWQDNVMAHVRAARQLVPLMIERGGGYFLNTASLAGLITGPHGVAYAVTKHAVVGFAEWLILTFLILPNPAVGGSFRKKAAGYDAWLDHTVRRLDAMRKPR